MILSVTKISIHADRVRRAKNLQPSLLVFVKGVVSRFHAASLISGSVILVYGVSQTGPAGCQLLVLNRPEFIGG